MTPEGVISDGSPLWPFLRKAYELGYHKMLIPEQVGGMGLNPLQVNIVMEEMGWGSFAWPYSSRFAASSRTQPPSPETRS